MASPPITPSSDSPGEGTLSSPNPSASSGSPHNFQQSLTPAAGNHPLAEASHSSLAPGSLPTGSSPATSTQYSIPSTAAESHTSPFSSGQIPRSGASNQNQYTSSVGSPPSKASSPALSLDDLVDKFLSGPSHRTHCGLLPLLRPPPLINEDPLQCLRTLVERRAWGDVLQITADLLKGADSIYAPIYNSMLFLGSDAQGQEAPTQLQEETAEIVALQCHAWLKLRRYADLGQEIKKWNFLPFNEHYLESEAPKWVPWSLREFLLQ